ncbi:DNA double-strand break repair protein Mre11 [Natronorarus salvus]|uniref:DNA double-strand break repair protein Mre11 n=1 Tax=Natronorarus salvus TaxID=3117733 RepID=UPI002F26B42B
MTRVIHTGDTHIGYRQYHREERRADFLAAFERVIDDAIDEDVDAVVHAGDLFHDRRPDLVDLLGTLDALRTLEGAGIPFLAIVGNHEGTRSDQWLDLYERLGLATRLDACGTVVGEVSFYGLDHVPESQREELSYEFEPTESEFAVLVSHGLFEPFAHANWDTEELLSRSTVEFDALLLGDNHVPGQQRVDETWVTYPGSTERASASEEDDRGYNLVTFDDGSSGDESGERTTGDGVRIARRGIETRPFVFCDVDLGEGEGVDRVLERVGQHELEDAVVIVRVAGEGEPITPAEVERYATDRGALVARMYDRREVESGTEIDVSFADPDEAVRERVREMGLSPVASAVDETVRASKLADSTVRMAVADTVRERLDDLDAFEGVDESKAEEGAVSGTEADLRTGAEDDPAEDTSESRGATETVDGAEADGRDGAATAVGRSEAAEAASDGGEESEPGETEDSEGDDQRSMEEYL